MNKDELITIINKHMANKDVGVGLLYCLSETEQINKLADELVEKLNLTHVSKPLNTVCKHQWVNEDFPNMSCKLCGEFR